ncbi:MAG: endolytic transglycosylase MltG [Oscillospiraceae bacterium]|nr:endolytic transglycosylase MltG [Oscillospiraceae bacterium]
MEQNENDVMLEENPDVPSEKEKESADIAAGSAEKTEEGSVSSENADTEQTGGAEQTEETGNDTVDSGAVQEDAPSEVVDHDEDEKYDEEYGDDEEYDEYDEYDEEEEAPKKRRKKRGGGHIIFGLLLSVVIISVSILSAVYILKCAKEIFGMDKSDIEIVVDIPMNSSTADIAEQLLAEGIIEDTFLFRMYSRIKGTDGTYIAGTHKLSANMDYGTIVDILQEEAENQRETADVVFPEGITIIKAAQILEDKGVCDAEEFIKVFNSSEFGFDFEEKVKISALKFYKMEGYLFPDTYQFYLEEDPRVVAKKIYKNFEARVTPDLYGRMNDLDMELEEVLTLASVVQAEAANTKDMKRVASVFYNRLNAPNEYPLLQSDPTTKYVNEVIKPNIDVKSDKMFEAYDTYQGAGLPPGPICNPGLDAINAVLYPAETDYFYFCSNIETGEFFFAETLAEHEQNLIEAGLV